MTEGTRTDGHVGRHGTAVVNGPEDDDLDCLAIDWHRIEADIRRLRQHIFTSLLEPGAVKAARSVLRGSRGSNAPGLPDHGGRLPRLKSIENRSRQPVLWVPPTAPESAIKRTRSGAEQRARTTVAGRRRAASQSGTYACARGPQARPAPRWTNSKGSVVVGDEGAQPRLAAVVVVPDGSGQRQ